MVHCAPSIQLRNPSRLYPNKYAAVFAFFVGTLEENNAFGSVAVQLAIPFSFDIDEDALDIGIKTALGFVLDAVQKPTNSNVFPQPSCLAIAGRSLCPPPVRAGYHAVALGNPQGSAID